MWRVPPRLAIALLVVSAGVTSVGLAMEYDADAPFESGGESSEWGHLPEDGCLSDHTAGYENSTATVDVNVCGTDALEGVFGKSNGTVAMWFGHSTDGPIGGDVFIEPHHDRTGVAYLHELGHALYGAEHTAGGVMQPTTDVEVGCELEPRTEEIATEFNTTRIEESGGCEVVVTPFGNVSAAE